MSYSFRSKVISLLFVGIFVGNCVPLKLERSALEFLSVVRMMTNRNTTATTGRVIVKINGLVGSGLVISLNGIEDLSIKANGDAIFQTTLKTGDSYSVTIKTQPSTPTQVCNIAGGSGTLTSGDVSSINLNCDPAKYSLSGTITGLLGTGLILSNGGETLSINSNGTFAFTSVYAVGTTYSVSITSSPVHPSQTCSLTNDSGTFSASNVTNISLSCAAPTARAIRVAVSGIASGNLSLTNNLSESLTITSNGSYVFNSDVAIGSPYSVVITSTPTSHTCVLSGASGTIAGVDAAVTANCFSLLEQTPANLSVLNTNQSFSLRFSSEVNITSCTPGAGNLSSGGIISFSLGTTNFTNDTLTVSTTTTWNPASVAQEINCTSAAGNTLAAGTRILRYTIPTLIRYVSSATGNDANAGTIGSPVRSIQRGISLIGACGAPPCAVLVEDGTYEAEDFGENFITLSAGVSLYGGYTVGSSFATRNSSAKLTIIQNSTPTVCGGAVIPLSPCKTLLIPNTVTNNSVVDGFKITSASHTSDTTAVVIVGGKPILSNNTISGNASTNSTGLVLVNFGGSSAADSAQGAIVNNIILGGSCNSISCQTAGIVYYSTIANLYPFIQINEITGGICSTTSCKSYGLFLGTGNSVNLSSFKFNKVYGGNIASLPAGTESGAMFIADPDTAGILTSNEISGGSGDTTFGIFLNANMPLEIGDSITKSGNSIFGGSSEGTSYGVRLGADGSVFSNSIHAGNVASSNAAITYGIFSSSGLVRISGNRIFGGIAKAEGSSFSASNGIYLNNLASNSFISGNHISAGNSINTGTSNAFAYGIYLFQVANWPINVSNNMIDGGLSSIAVGTNTSESHGLVLSNSTVATKISYNTIFSGTSSDASTAISYLGAGTRLAEINNNILYTQVGALSRICFNHAGTTEASNVTSMAGNVFYGCTILIKYPTISADNICAGGVVSDSGCTTTTISTPSSLNVYVDPVLSSLSTTYSMIYRYYSANSPCSATQINNPLASPTFDSLGAARPGSVAGVSAGALEYDGSCQ